MTLLIIPQCKEKWTWRWAKLCNLSAPYQEIMCKTPRHPYKDKNTQMHLKLKTALHNSTYFWVLLYKMFCWVFQTQWVLMLPCQWLDPPLRSIQSLCICGMSSKVSLFTVGGPLRPGIWPGFDSAPLLMFTKMGR